MASPVAAWSAEDLLAINDALGALEAEASRLAEVVEWYMRSSKNDDGSVTATSSSMSLGFELDAGHWRLAD